MYSVKRRATMDEKLWGVFLPENILVHSARFDGANGEASIWFSYAGSANIHKATIKRDSAGKWHLFEICEKFD